MSRPLVGQFVQIGPEMVSRIKHSSGKMTEQPCLVFMAPDMWVFVVNCLHNWCSCGHIRSHKFGTCGSPCSARRVFVMTVPEALACPRTTSLKQILSTADKGTKQKAFPLLFNSLLERLNVGRGTCMLDTHSKRRIPLVSYPLKKS